MKRFWMRKVAGFIVLAVLGVVVFSSIVMLLWNALMPVIFHLPLISFAQALGLLILSKILFGGFRGGGPRQHWKNKMKQRWMNMTAEEKEKFKQEWSNRCQGRGPFRGPGGGPFGQENPFAPGGPFSEDKPSPAESAS